MKGFRPAGPLANVPPPAEGEDTTTPPLPGQAATLEAWHPLLPRRYTHPAVLLRWGRILALLFPLLLYAGSLGNDFLIDDETIITSNIRLAPGQSPAEILRRPEQFADFTLPYYRPLTNLSYWVDARLWNGEPGGFHLTNWLLHAANTWLVFELARALSASPLFGLLTALLFAAHPIHTESVDMVQGRTDLLATLFLLASLLALWRYGRTRGLETTIVAGAGSLLALGAALLAKEIAVMWPALALALSWTESAQGAEPRRRRGILLAAGMAILVAYLLVRQAVLGKILPADLHSLGTPRLGLAPITLLTYGRLLLWPFTFSFIRPIAVPQSWADPRVLGSSLLVLAVLAGLLLLARRNRLMVFGTWWILLSLLPVLNLIPIPGFTLAERYLYLPSVGFSLLGAALLRQALLTSPMPGARMFALGLLAGLLIAFTATIQVRTAEWGDPVRVYEGMAARTPTSFFVQSNLGLEYLKDGRFQDAIAALTRARDLEPANPIAWNNLGAALARSGHLIAARQAYERAIALNPGYAKAYQNLGDVLLVLGDRSGARAASQRARELRRQ